MRVALDFERFQKHVNTSPREKRKNATKTLFQNAITFRNAPKMLFRNAPEILLKCNFVFSWFSKLKLPRNVLKIDPNQAKLDTMRAKAEEQLKRSPLKGAEAVAAILHDLQALDPKFVPSFSAATAGDPAPAGQLLQNKVKRERRAEDATLFEFCCEPASLLG